MPVLIAISTYTPGHLTHFFKAHSIISKVICLYYIFTSMGAHGIRVYIVALVPVDRMC